MPFPTLLLSSGHMESRGPQPPSPDSRSRISLITGIVFLFLMASFWAVDDSIVTIAAGLALFFLFLSFYLRPRRPNDPRQTRDQAHQWSTQRKSTRSFEVAYTWSISSNLRQALQRFGMQSAGGGTRMLRGCLFVAMASVVIAIALSIILGSRGDDDTYTLARAQSQLMAGELDSARINYGRVYRRDPDNVEAALGYGKVLLVLEKPDSAMLLFDRVLANEPNHAEAIYNKAYVLYGASKYREGRELLQPMVEQHPEYYDALLLLGDFFYVEKNYEDAFSSYDKAYREANARGSLLCQRLGYLYDTREEYDQAVSLYQEALTYDSTLTEIYQRLGELLPGDDGNYYRARAQQANP